MKPNLRAVSIADDVGSPIGEAELQAMVTRALAAGPLVNCVLLYETGAETLRWSHPTASLTAAKGLVAEAFEWLCAAPGVAEE